MTKAAWFRPAIFSVNCYIATILTMFIAFSLDLKSPGWAMTTVYLTSQPISGAMRAKAFYRVIGTFVGGAMMVAIVPNLIDAPELTTAAIILWVTLCLFIALHDRTPRSYMFVLSGYTAALIGFPSVLAPATVFDTAVSRVEEITVGVVCAALVHGLIFPQSALSAFQAKLTSALADARRWIADGLTRTATPQDGNGAAAHRRRHHASFMSSPPACASTPRRFIPISAASAPSTARSSRCCRCSPRSRIASACCAARVACGQDRACRAGRSRLGADGGAERSGPAPTSCGKLASQPPSVGERNSWADLVAANVTERLAELIESWQASLDFAAYLADPSRQPSAEIRALGAQLGREAAAYRLGHRVALGAIRDRGDGHVHLLLDRHCVARGGQCRGYCRRRLHLVRHS